MGGFLTDFDQTDENYKRAKKAALNGDKEYVTEDGETRVLSRSDRRALRSSQRLKNKRNVEKIPSGFISHPD
jgi:hypothetical protein